MVILDISMPGKSGLDILDDLHRLRPKLPILLLRMHPEGQFARRALKSGAAGYLTKESVPEELKEAVRRVQAGGRYVSATLARNWRLTCRKDADVPVHELLSDREFQVLRLLASGKTVKQIADEISLSVKTVSTYRARILLETGMKTTAELIRYALQAGLVDYGECLTAGANSFLDKSEEFGKIPGMLRELIEKEFKAHSSLR